MAGVSGDREKAVQQAVSAIERQFGKGAIMRLGENAILPQMDEIGRASCRERV